MSMLIIVFVLNFTLYLYGVELPVNSWFDTGAAQRDTSEIIATGAAKGKFTTTQGMQDLLSMIWGAIIIGGGAGIVVSWAGGDQTINWIMPVAMIGTIFATLMLSPMGNIIGTAENEDSMHCYDMTETTTFGGEPMAMCLPTEAHLLLSIILGLMMVATIMGFIRGGAW